MSTNNVLNALKAKKETAYFNSSVKHCELMSEISGKKFTHVRAAQNRLVRFMPYIRNSFPDTEKRLGIIESDVLDISDMVDFYKKNGIEFKGRLLLKDDAHLPISGSVKARGGIYEVLKYAESLASKEKGFNPAEDHTILSSEEYRDLFSHYTIHVASTGNLGLSVGIMGTTLGFKVVVHMSSDAREWKKKKLRELGAQVIEYSSDYSAAVEKGREEAGKDPFSYFVDDENSIDLFMGYATAALRLKVQLYNANIQVTKEHPLFVYLPCGVGGAPGGITYGLKQMFGDNVHCFFMEPVAAPCFTYAVAKATTPSHISGLGLVSSETIADGLAVGRASKLVYEMVSPIISGCMTVCDDKMLIYQKAFYDIENIYVEPSAAVGFHGPAILFGTDEGTKYLKEQGLAGTIDGSTHIVWATGGGMVPLEERNI